MTVEQLIVSILNAKSPRDVFKSDITSEYKRIAKLIHPDVCKVNKSNEAFVKLNELKSLLEFGKTFNDDIGTITIKENIVIIKGDKNYLKISFDNYNILKSYKHPVFDKYLPTKAELKDDQLIFTGHPENIYMIGDMRNPLEIEHVRWIFSRIIEFTSWLSTIGYSHAGINPFSIGIIPKTHGILFLSFYHMKPIGQNLKTISGKYINWYPIKSIKNKLSTSDIDISLAKNLAIYMMGDKSGNGVKLRSKINPTFINFFIKSHKNSMDAFSEYRELIKIFGKPKFYELIM